MLNEERTSHSPKWFSFQVAARRVFNRIPVTENQKIYLLTMIIGCVCGLAAVCFHLLLDFFQNHLIYRAATIPRWWIPLLLCIPAIGGLISGAGLYFYAPRARGSGIPQVKTAYYLEGGRIPARVIWSKMFLSAFNIGTGASLGREGPTVQICAAIASVLGRMFAISRKRLQSLIPVGAAAGLAAAFNTPIAAVTFTLEEILGQAESRPLGSIVIAAVIAAVIERAILGEHALFNVPPYRLNRPVELIFYAVLGVLAGFAAVAFNEGLLHLRAFFKTQRVVPQWAAPGVGGLILGCVGIVALHLTGSSSTFGVGYGQLGIALQMPLPLKMLIVLGIAKLIGTVISYSSGSSGGIFGPSLYIGGMLGGAVGLAKQHLLGDPATQPGAFALVGMGAVFAGIVRAPVTSIIIIFEMTNNYSIILPLMIANITSYVLASEISPTPIYDALLEQDGIHLPHEQRHALKQLPVSAAMSDTIETLSETETVGEVFARLEQQTNRFHAYPVIDANGSLVGICTFNDLKRALSANESHRSLGATARKNVKTITQRETLDAALVKMGRNGVSQLPVINENESSKPVGMITLEDIARRLACHNEGRQ
ncbi:MAG TPA: chloride channel protein [Pyrinomonadaceae bacterium]|nr:chloride channel protein [Pyrinomonadaceae bacterium]